MYEGPSRGGFVLFAFLYAADQQLDASKNPWSNRRQTDSLRQVEDGGWNGWATGLF
jgi:hypothetical protein